MKRSSCNFVTIINDDESFRSSVSRSQIRRRRNRFSFSCNYRSHAAASSSSSSSSLSMLLLLLVAALMLPCLSARSLAEPTTTLSSTDFDNIHELTTESAKTPSPIIPPPLADTTTNLSKAEENNEIFAILEISPDAVKPKFELSEKSITGDLEETIRNSVKIEIEMEQNLGSAAILDVLKDIPETEVRQKIAEEIFSIDYPHKNTKEHNFDSRAELPAATEKQLATSVSSTPTNDIKVPKDDLEKDIIFNNLSSKVSEESIGQTKNLQHVEANIREARNLDAEIEVIANGSSNIESAYVGKVEEDIHIESSTSKNIELIEKNIEEKLNLETALSSSDSSPVSSASESDTIENTVVEKNPNTGDSIDSRNTQIIENKIDFTTSTSSKAIEVEIPDFHDTSTIPSIDDDGLSIVLDETLSVTEQPTLLDSQKLQSFINLETTNDISNVDEITSSPEENIHIVIKKQGVDLNELPIDTISNEDLDIVSQTTVLSVTEKIYHELQSGNTEFPFEIVKSVTKEDSIELDEHEIDLQKFTTVQPEVNKQQEVDIEQPKIPSVEAIITTTTETIEITTVEPEEQSHTEIDSFTTAFVSDNEFVITLKGSRSIHTNRSPLSNMDETAATLFEAFPPRDAGQTFNDNLAAESSGGIGKALPTSRNNNVATNRSGVIIVLCSGTAILFIVILTVIFLISFQRQHGTLDIEMQEQRCGKDNLEEEDAETFIKLLNIELPRPTNAVDADETDECL